MNIYKLFQTPQESWKTILKKSDFKEFAFFMHSSYTEFYEDFPQRADIIEKIRPYLGDKFEFVYIAWKDKTFYISTEGSDFLDFPAKVVGFSTFEECKKMEGNQDIHYGKTEKKDIMLEETKEKPAEEEIDPEIIISGLQKRCKELTQEIYRVKLELRNEINTFEDQTKKVKKLSLAVDFLKTDNILLRRQLGFTTKIADKACSQFGFTFNAPEMSTEELEKRIKEIEEMDIS